MLLLLFHIGDNLYAIETDRVIEIVPMVLLRTVEFAPAHVAGVFNYRGTIVPVIDLCRLLAGTTCAVRYSTRVILVRHGADARPLGLLAERVTETVQVSADQLREAEQVGSSPYLGELLIHPKGLIQTINWEQLMTDAEQALWTESEERTYGAGSN